MGQEANNTVELPSYTVTAMRSWSEADSLSALDRSWDTQSLSKYVPRTVDQVLYQDPAFSFYRRQNAVFAAPQTQGVSLRSIGPTAAARSLVLRDGIPQNDPFGGWVPWARYTPRAIKEVRILPGNQAAGWGQLSAGGVIIVESLAPTEEMHRAQVTVGSFDTVAADTQHSFVEGRHGVFVNIAASDSDGDDLIHPSDRGPIDETNEFDTFGVDFRHHFQLNDQLRIVSGISYYDEERNNGTPATYYNTEAYDVSMRVVGVRPDLEWSASGYYQDRSMESLFSSVNDDRTAETPVLDQFDIPAEGIGGNFVVASEDFDTFRVVAGADVRYLDGETNEDVLIPNRRREAGGEQTQTGLFASFSNPSDQLNAYELNLRLDRWSLDNGSRTERSNASGVVSLDESYRDRSDWEPSISFAAESHLSETIRLNIGSGYTYRLPTINELYRPFRVGSDITEANPELSPERFLNAELGVSWLVLDTLTVESGIYHYWIDDAIANVRTDAPAGVFVPGDGSYSERQNVESSTVFGWQSRIEYRPFQGLTISVDYLYSEAEFEDSDVQPELEGNRFPQVPKHKATASVDYWIQPDLLLFGALEYGSSQYDDPLNSRKLPRFMTGQVGASYQVNEVVRVTGRVDNLADALVITGERSNGVRSIAPGRSFWLTVLVDW